MSPSNIIKIFKNNLKNLKPLLTLIAILKKLSSIIKGIVIAKFK
jgi:hypothetical protein